LHDYETIPPSDTSSLRDLNPQLVTNKDMTVLDVCSPLWSFDKSVLHTNQSLRDHRGMPASVSK